MFFSPGTAWRQLKIVIKFRQNNSSQNNKFILSTVILPYLEASEFFYLENMVISNIDANYRRAVPRVW